MPNVNITTDIIKNCRVTGSVRGGIYHAADSDFRRRFSSVSPPRFISRRYSSAIRSAFSAPMAPLVSIWQTRTADRPTRAPNSAWVIPRLRRSRRIGWYSSIKASLKDIRPARNPFFRLAVNHWIIEEIPESAYDFRHGK